MTKRFLRFFVLIMVSMFLLPSFTACGASLGRDEGGSYYDIGVVHAFNSVVIPDAISQTAVAELEDYSVIVITSSSVSEYRVNSAFEIENVNSIFGSGETVSAYAAMQSETNTQSDLERAYEEALKLSGIAASEVQGFDFDKDIYMGKSVFKVEIEDSYAEYSFIFGADDFNLIDKKTELKNAESTTEDSSYIGEQQAKDIALEIVGADESEIKALTIKSLLNNGRKIYKVKFDFAGFEYSVDIDALKGDIVRLSKKILDENVSNPDIPDIIDENRAKEIAIAFVFPEGLTGKDAKFRKVKLDYEDGRFVYEVEFTVDSNEYEIEISASDGQIIDIEIDTDDDTKQLPQNGKFITREQAVAKLREYLGKDIFIFEIDIEKMNETGKPSYYYEIKIQIDNQEREYYVDAITGEVRINDDYAGDESSPSLTQEDAMEIALNTFGLTSDKITSQKIKLEKEDGILCYEIELIASGIEYSVTIDARNGNIIEKEIDNEDIEDLPPEGEYISEEQARKNLKDKLGQNVIIKEIELESTGKGENRRFYYEAEIVINGRKYDYCVDAITGEVSLKGEFIESDKNIISKERAVEIALQYFSSTQQEAKLIKVKLEDDDGILIYEVKFKVRDIIYTIEIDAVTGEILDKDISFD